MFKLLSAAGVLGVVVAATMTHAAAAPPAADGAWAPDLDRATVATDGVGALAPVEPGPWTSYSPSFRVQERGCGDVNNLTFTLSCSTASGDQRAERRYATYTSGTRQFQGYFRITSMGGSRISLKQTFRHQVGAYFMLAVERGGRLYRVGGDTIATGATIGTTVRVNTVHVVGGTHRTYINGSLRHSYSSPRGAFYDKFGAYRTASGRGPITVVWSGVEFWRK